MNKRSPLPSRAGQTFQLGSYSKRDSHLAEQSTYLVLGLYPGSLSMHRCLKLEEGKVVLIGERELQRHELAGRRLA